MPSALITGHHRPGRLLPGRAAAREGLRGARHGPPRVDGEVRPHRAPARPDHAAPGRPARPALAASTRCAPPSPDEVYNLAAMSFVAVSWIQPTLTAEFTGVGVTRMLEAVREVVPGDALLPGVLERDVRQGARDAADRDDAVLPALAVRRGEGLRPPHHGQLPRVLRPVRDAPGSSSTTSRERRGLEFVTRKITWHAAAIKHGSATSSRSATSTPSATGATRRTTSRRCG